MKGAPDFSGGGTVKIVTHDYISWDDPPEKEEAGTPNVMGVAALAASIRTLNKIGMNKISNYEKDLTCYALNSLKNIPEILLYDDIPFNNRVSIIPFNIKDIPHSITARLLSDEGGISVRNGCFCAQPYVQKLLKTPSNEVEKFIENPLIPRPGMVRISFGLYNETYEIDKLIVLLKGIIKNKNKYLNLYSHYIK
jgi:selenocysteine lyase/cysteine desulfurase